MTSLGLIRELSSFELAPEAQRPLKNVIVTFQQWFLIFPGSLCLSLVHPGGAHLSIGTVKDSPKKEPGIWVFNE
jgi:hypothetical protein